MSQSASSSASFVPTQHDVERVLRVFDDNWIQYEHARLYGAAEDPSIAAPPPSKLTTPQNTNVPDSNVEGVLPPAQTSQLLQAVKPKLMLEAVGKDNAAQRLSRKRIAVLAHELRNDATIEPFPMRSTLGEASSSSEIPASVQVCLIHCMRRVSNSKTTFACSGPSKPCFH